MERRNWLRLAGAGLASGLFVDDFWKSLDARFLESQNIGLETPLIRLSSNENPYGPSERVRQAMSDAFEISCRYPWSFHDQLLNLLATKHNVTKDHIVLCAGSNEGLRMTALAYFSNKSNIVAPTPTYDALMAYAVHLGSKIKRIPLNKDLRIDINSMLEAIDDQTAMVFMCNPNNPTGDLIPASEFTSFCTSVSEKTLLFSDEAYADYILQSDYPSMIQLVRDGKNVVVSKTFSKVYGLAGVRAGYLIARPDIAEKIKKYSMASMNVLAIYAAIEALNDNEFYEFSLRKNKQILQMMYNAFDAKGLKYVKSQANFVFVNVGMQNEAFRKKMLEHNILTGRDFNPMTDWARISCGTVEEVNKFIYAFNRVL